MKTDDVAQDTPDSGESEPEKPKGKPYNRQERRLIEQEWARKDRQQWRELYRAGKREERATV